MRSDKSGRHVKGMVYFTTQKYEKNRKSERSKNNKERKKERKTERKNVDSVKMLQNGTPLSKRSSRGKVSITGPKTKTGLIIFHVIC